MELVERLGRGAGMVGILQVHAESQRVTLDRPRERPHSTGNLCGSGLLLSN